MTEAQQEDLFIEWSLYEDITRKAMINEYLELRRDWSCVSIPEQTGHRFHVESVSGLLWNTQL